jgi:hypothetical protein
MPTLQLRHFETDDNLVEVEVSGGDYGGRKRVNCVIVVLMTMDRLLLWLIFKTFVYTCLTSEVISGL